jgi:hypothetical protein
MGQRTTKQRRSEKAPSMARQSTPRMGVDRAAFLSRVLEQPAMRSTGVFFGRERVRGFRLDWVVLDPRHHTLYVWAKHEDSFPRAGRALGASVFTSGPFTNHAGGSPLKATVKIALDVLAACRRPSTVPSAAHDAIVRHYRAAKPLGHVIGTHAGIHETEVDRPRVSHFGRGDGTAFADYVIARGDPDGCTEAIGGLYRPLADYQPYSGDRVLRTGYWGLAPLRENPIARGRALDAAIADGCDGLIVFVAGRANTGRLATLLASIGVRDAVQVDGGDSLLLGRGHSVVVGRCMPTWKRLLQVWGIEFRAELLD